MASATSTTAVSVWTRVSALADARRACVCGARGVDYERDATGLVALCVGCAALYHTMAAAAAAPLAPAANAATANGRKEPPPPPPVSIAAIPPSPTTPTSLAVRGYEMDGYCD